MNSKLKEKINLKNIIVVIVFVVLVAILLTRFIGGEQNTYAEAQPPLVEVDMPKQGSISVGSSLIGTVEPSEVQYVMPEISGEVTSVKVKAGQKISAGQTICTIENKQQENARISMQTAQLNLSNAKSEMDRSEALYASGDISKQSYDDAKNALARAQLSYESSVNEYNNQSAYSTVTASISGVVESCDVEVFDKVTPQTQLCVIAGGGEKVVSFDATDIITKLMKIGDKIIVEKAGTKSEGTISEISTMVDESSGLFKIKASLSQDANLATGTSAKVYVTADKVSNAMIIPAMAVYYENGKAFVYLYEDGTAKKVPIEVGLSDDENIEVISGLNNRDRIVNTWSAELYDGARVEAKQEINDKIKENQEAN
ncbi:MAG: efflux RND transporter periplasmic adaptor subunit [Aminipila sp.]